MSYLDAGSGAVVNQLSVDQRAGFIRRTYGHVAMAVAAMAVFCALFLQMGLGPVLLNFIGAGTLNFFIFIGLFIGAGILADNWARSEQSTTMHYVALFGYAAVEALVVTPALFVATMVDPSAIADAAIVTAALVTGLTWIAFTTKKDFSFLRPFLMIGSIVALGACAAGAIFGFGIGVYGSAAIVMLAAGFILYNTSNIMYHYQEHQHVAAAVSLFASIALMFRFVLNMFLLAGDD